jgi:ribosomal protein S24E
MEKTVIKASFDFDSTLDRKDVQELAKELLAEGVEVWIVTSRKDVYTNPYTMAGVKVYPTNEDLFKVATEVGISHDNVIFTCHDDKVDFIEGKDFAFHIDDDDIELGLILRSTDPCVPLHVDHTDWKFNCNQVIKKRRFKNEGK